MDQPVCPTEINEGSEVTQTTDDPAPVFAFLEFFQQRFLARIAAIALGITLAEDEPPPLAVDFDHLDGDLFANEVGHVALAIIFIQTARYVHHMAGGYEAA